ncbi:hypothetical protein KC19_11G133200 [Ceratodon purpureus]|uniref:Uncharacterized protein n=1 Tax=Ceratodon purpureus TaxID=3225 RepID=A0A8T0GEK4_CERPU|nr:hypothetical protein KC19_11G133200 [Ceratodon purpureus]
MTPPTGGTWARSTALPFMASCYSALQVLALPLLLLPKQGRQESGPGPDSGAPMCGPFLGVACTANLERLTNHAPKSGPNSYPRDIWS